MCQGNACVLVQKEAVKTRGHGTTCLLRTSLASGEGTTVSANTVEQKICRCKSLGESPTQIPGKRS